MDKNTIAKNVRISTSLPVLVLFPVLLFLSGCGHEGPPMPPVRHVPVGCKDLQICQKADKALLEFTAALKNTDGSPLEDLAAVLIYRDAEPLESVESKVKGKEGRLMIPPAPKFLKKAVKVAEVPGKKLEAATEKGKVFFPVLSLEKEIQEKPDTVAFYAIENVNKRGQRSDLSSIVPFVAQKAPPAPSNLAFSLSENLCTLKWDPVEPPEKAGWKKVEGYNVYRRLEGRTLPHSPLNGEPLRDPSYEDKTQIYGETYYYAVPAFISGGAQRIEGFPSDEIKVSPRDVYAPQPPQGVVAISGRGFIKLMWKPNAEADLAGYVIYKKKASETKWARLNPVPLAETNYTDSNVKEGEAYQYRITAVDNAESPNESTPSEEVTETGI